MKRGKFLKTLAGLPLVLSQLSFSKKPRNLEKTIFTPEMLYRNNYGLFIINVKAGDVLTTKNLEYAATVAWKLTYSLGFRGGRERSSITNVFTDGWTFPIPNSESYEEVCEWLNNNPYGDEYRLMTKEEVLFMISKRQQGFL